MSEERKRFTKENVFLRRSTIAKYRVEGMTYEAITEKLINEFGSDNLPRNYDAAECYKDMQYYLEKMRTQSQETVNEIINLETLRLDTYLQNLKDNILKGDVRSIEAALKIGERRAKLLGLDAAIKVDWKVEIADLFNRGLMSLDEIKRELGDALFDEFLAYNSQLAIVDSTFEVVKEDD